MLNCGNVLGIKGVDVKIKFDKSYKELILDYLSFPVVQIKAIVRENQDINAGFVTHIGNLWCIACIFGRQSKDRICHVIFGMDEMNT